MSECVYTAPAERAARLIDKGTRAWQRLQAHAMAHDELFDSLVLRGQTLWMPHHETDGAQFTVTLVADIRCAPEQRPHAAESLDLLWQELAGDLNDEWGSVDLDATYH
jgi:hypothetical protein